MIGMGVGVVVMVRRAGIVSSVRLAELMGVSVLMGMSVLVRVAMPLGWAGVVGVAVGMVMAMAGTERQRHAIGLAGPRALPFTQVAAFDQALHVVVVALLGQAHLLLEAQHLSPVLA